MNYIQPLLAYKFNLQSKKLQGLARLAQLKLPTVSNLFVVLPKLYQDYQQTKKTSPQAKRELETVFNSIKKQGKTITLRNSIYEENNPGIAFSVHNSLNLNSFDDFYKKIIQGYNIAAKEAIDVNQVEFCYLIQSFYSSEKCGSLLSSNGQGQIYLQAIHGQHTQLLLRGDVDPDTYLINKKTYKIEHREIVSKQFRVKKLRTGIKKIRVKKVEQNKAVLTDYQIQHLAKMSQIVEVKFGPQEMEWAVLDSGEIIFQETRDFLLADKLEFHQKTEVIFPAKTKGKVINLSTIPKRISLQDKIVITDNLSIHFINQLAFVHRPLAIILTRGSVTSHAATILRESKLTTVLARGVDFDDGELITIEKNGEIKKVV